MTTNKSKGYKIDFVNRTITITHWFQKAANVEKSAACRTLKKLIRDFPDFEISFAAPRSKKASGQRLTYDMMIQYICKQEDSEKLLKDFSEVRYPKDCLTSAKYGVVKKWFMARFPHYNQMTQFDENGNITRPEVAEIKEQGAQEKPTSDQSIERAA